MRRRLLFTLISFVACGVIGLSVLTTDRPLPWLVTWSVVSTHPKHPIDDFTKNNVVPLPTDKLVQAPSDGVDEDDDAYYGVDVRPTKPAGLKSSHFIHTARNAENHPSKPTTIVNVVHDQDKKQPKGKKPKHKNWKTILKEKYADVLATHFRFDLLSLYTNVTQNNDREPLDDTYHRRNAPANAHKLYRKYQKYLQERERMNVERQQRNNEKKSTE